MPLSTSRRRARQKGSTLMIMTLMMPLFLIPLVGLAVDGARLYIVQAKLATAVDGAALGAGRLLGTPINASEIAGEFLQVNFPTGYWGTSNFTPNITYTSSFGSNTIAVNATVQVPLLFMRILGNSAGTVGAAATATRRDTRVVLVLDRSGSMDHVDPATGINVFSALKNAAASFTQRFRPNYDQLGLVVYSQSALVAYPAQALPYSINPFSTGGPDASFSTATPNIVSQINALNPGGWTSMGEALSMAYIELQKAHNRDLAAHGVDNVLNAVMLFTDGVPNTIAISPNNPAESVIDHHSPCDNQPGGALGSATRMRGWMPPGGSGIYLLAAYDTAQPLSYWLANPTADNRISNPASAVAGCDGLGNGGNFTTNELKRIPAHDLYGVSTDGNGYTNSAVAYDGTAYNHDKVSESYHDILAAWNVADNVALLLRTQNVMGQIGVFTIGYTGNGGTDAPLLRRIANTQESTTYDPNQVTGLYLQVDQADQLTPAFNAVASELLRLSK